MKLRITGFGACMIAGFPLSRESSFMEHAKRYLEARGQFQVELKLVSMGGFPAERAGKYFCSKALSSRPDIMVIQLGSTDAGAPLRNAFILRHLRKKKHRSGREQVSSMSPTLSDVIKWQLRSVASDFLLAPPNTPLDIYLAAVVKMVRSCHSAGVPVAVLSPFVMGGWRSNRFAKRYARALGENLPRDPAVYYLNAHSVLSCGPRRETLLQDGFHLSAIAHQKLGRQVAELLAVIVRQELALASRASNDN